MNSNIANPCTHITTPNTNNIDTDQEKQITLKLINYHISKPCCAVGMIRAHEHSNYLYLLLAESKTPRLGRVTLTWTNLNAGTFPNLRFCCYATTMTLLSVMDVAKGVLNLTQSPSLTFLRISLIWVIRTPNHHRAFA